VGGPPLIHGTATATTTTSVKARNATASTKRRTALRPTPAFGVATPISVGSRDRPNRVIGGGHADHRTVAAHAVNGAEIEPLDATLATG
jgi:hypothetical protein